MKNWLFNIFVDDDKPCLNSRSFQFNLLIKLSIIHQRMRLYNHNINKRLLCSTSSKKKVTVLTMNVFKTKSQFIKCNIMQPMPSYNGCVCDATFFEATMKEL